MPIIHEFKLPDDASALGRNRTNSTAPFFITFTTSDHPDTGESWCPDFRAALPHIIAAFSPLSTPEMAFVEVGQRPEIWRVPTNVFRTKWNVNNVPTIVRYELSDGEVKETARLVEGEILDEKRLRLLISKNS
ncbi:hypothetical protein BDP81DRAFT_371946 [Colletotrichum phormii]|uniref:Thioredoxin domain-containing protein n=1 Tax=Colletotrichum phormii TaxID=359342 RepID=A0AAI9ZX52_9PEZI|nr:uncharacterized protein BDP81DRAFT_371946 [Colletotrichum phormii]KAK1638474.1 hypothetical protein BDP81DRAFT_371946 [Colletotrichum phormii]